MNSDKCQAGNIIAIRGATTCENTNASISNASIELMNELKLQNCLDMEQIVSVIISTTADLTKSYPAKAIRESGCSAPLFSCLEPPIENALSKCIRIMVTAYSGTAAKHVYLRGAKVLRPDLVN